MMEFVESGLPRDVNEYHGSVIHKSTGGNRSRLGVFYRWMRRTGGDTHRLRLLGIAFFGSLRHAIQGKQHHQQEKRVKTS